MPLVGTQTQLGVSKNSVRVPLALSTDATGTTNAFLAKYTNTGALLWTARISGSGTATTMLIYSTATDSTGAIYGVGAAPLGASSSVLFYNSDGSYASTMFVQNRTVGNTRIPFLVKYNAGGVFQWAGYLSLYGTQGPSQFGYGVTVDPSDGVYMSGIVGGNGNTVTAYNADGSAFATPYVSGSGAAGDAFLVKYNTSGTVQWLTRVRVPAPDDFGYGLASDSSGVYLSGQVGSGTVTAFNAAGTTGGTLTTTSADGLIIKYSLTGTVSWLTRVSSTAADASWAAALDSAGNLYVTGQYGAAALTAFSAGGGAFGTTLASIGGGDSFLVKYNSSGAVQWVARMGGSAADIGYGLATDSGNNVYLIGSQGAATFTAYNAAGTAFGTTLTSRGGTDAFLVKYDSSGVVQWVAQIAGTAADVGYSLVTDASSNLYAVVSTASASLVVYNFDGTTFTSLSPSTNPASALVQYNSSGTAQRAVLLNSSTTPYGICRDASTNLIVGGTTSANVARALGPSASIALSLASSTTDAYLVKYTTNGQPLWAARISAAVFGVRGLVTNSLREVYAVVSGGANGTMTIFNASGTSFTTVPQNQAAVIKYNSAGAVQWVASFTAVGGGAGGIALDSTGAVYVVQQGGSASGVFTVLNANGTTAFTRSDSATRTGASGILVKYSSDGVAQWISTLTDSSTNTARFNAISIASDDSIFVSGSTSLSGTTTLTNGNGTNAQGGTNSFGNFVACIIKYNTSGTCLWRTGAAFSGTGGVTISGLGVATDSAGGSYLSVYGGGSTASTTFYSVGSGNALTSFRVLGNPTTGGTDGYVIKYNSSGIGQWVTEITSTDSETMTGLLCDSVTGSLYVLGTSGSGSSTAAVSFPWVSNANLYIPTLAKTGAVGFLTKYSTLADTFPLPRWTFRFDSSDTTGAATDTAWAVATDRRGTIYVACHMNNVAGATGIIGDAAVPSYSIPAGTNVTVACFSAQGTLRWYQSVRGSSTFQRALSVATDLDCNVYIGGDTNGQTVNIYAKA